MTLGGNLGYNYLGTGDGDFVYTLVYGFPINDKFGLYIEPYGQVTNLETFTLNINSGMTYLLNPRMQFDISYGTGILERMNYVTAGFSFLIEGQEASK